MSAVLERRYRRVLQAAWPATLRTRHGEEVIGTLMDVAGSDQAWPAVGQVLGLMRAGIGEQIAAARRRSAGQNWTGAVQLAVLFLLALATADDVANLTTRGWIARPSFAALLLAWVVPVAVVRGRLAVALLLTCGWAVLHARAGMPAPDLRVAAVMLMLLVARSRGQRRQLSVAWLMVVPLIVAVVLLPQWLEQRDLRWSVWMSQWRIPVAPAIFVLLVLAALAVVLDPRVPIAAGLAAFALSLYVIAGAPESLGDAWATAAIAAVLAAGGHLTTRLPARL